LRHAQNPNLVFTSDLGFVDNRFFGIVIQDGDGNASENTITGGQVGIAVAAGSADTIGVLRGNKIKNTSVVPVQEIECCGFTATAIVQ